MARRVVKPVIRVGTRASLLALAQTRSVLRAFSRAKGRYAFKVIPIATEGDRDRRVNAWSETPSVGLFTKALEDALRTGRIDAAVHSLKDLPVATPRLFKLAYFSKREDPRDALISASGQKLKDFAPGSVIGTSSIRRRHFVLSERPDLRLRPLRGNITTRIRKTLKDRRFDGILLAQAGLKRLKLSSQAAEVISTNRLVPAAGQGIVVIECRKSDQSLMRFFKSVSCAESERAAVAERACMSELGAGCRIPVGIHAKLKAGSLEMSCVVYGPQGEVYRLTRRSTKLTNPANEGRRLARGLVSRYPEARAILKAQR